MVNIFKILIFVLFFTASLLAGDSGVIRGAVENKTNLPITGAKVVFYTDDYKPVDSVQTDMNGSFSIRLPANKYYISAFAFNYCRKYYPNAYMKEMAAPVNLHSSQVRNVNLTLERGGLICGEIEISGQEAVRFIVSAIKANEPHKGWICEQEFSVSSFGDYCLDGLLPGYYKLMIRGDNYGSEYYPGVENIENAELVEVEQGSIIGNINFDIDQPGTGRIDGLVYVQESNEPIVGAEIIAYQWFNPDVDPHSVRVFTDEDGRYEMTLVSGYYYITAVINHGSSRDEAINIYYDNRLASEYASAIWVEQGQTLSGIDFTIDRRKQYNLRIYGNLAEMTMAVPVSGARITALDYNTGIPIASTRSKDNGEFEIENLISGSYLLEISGYNIIHSFWPDVISWQEADVVILGADDYIVYNGGAITQDYGTPSFRISGSISGNGEPVSNVRVYAINVESEKMTYSLTNDNGEYNISDGLHEGSYLVFADKYGWDGNYYPYPLELDLIYHPVEDNIDIELNQVYLSVEDNPNDLLPEAISLIGNYPNPFNNSTNIMLSLDESTISALEIYNISGQLVTTIPFTANPGLSTIAWNGTSANGKNVSSGVYYYKIADLPEVKKMILLK